MNLYLLRHGEAEANAEDDSSRRLTPRGREEVISVARQFRARNLPLGRCIASPFLRAGQTAQAFLAELGSGIPVPEVEINALLTPESRAWELMDFIAGQSVDSLMLVSHNPLLSELNALLLDGDTANMAILGTGDLVCIDLDIAGPGLGRSRFHLTPDLRYAGA